MQTKFMCSLGDTQCYFLPLQCLVYRLKGQSEYSVGHRPVRLKFEYDKLVCIYVRLSFMICHFFIHLPL